MRRKTIKVKVGNKELSCTAPVLIQSMLNTSTMETETCVEQAIRIIEAGGELVRITAQGVKEARNLKNIKEELERRGYPIPLSADIHFNTEAALEAAKYVDKVRINPGNFADKRAVFQNIEYTDEEYKSELEKLREKFIHFLNVCKEYNTTVRVGTNHGSLSDRILNRYGNTPSGMVEATMEYLRICKDTDFKDVVISLKSSDCGVMIDAVRLLVKEMEKEGMNYPIHLGVTEAGEGEDGRIRSAVGIGTLLNEGIGDTIRVSLTEEPEREIPVAKMLVELSTPFYKENREIRKGNYNKPVIVADLSKYEIVNEEVMFKLGFTEKEVNPTYGIKLVSDTKTPEIIYTESLSPELSKLPEDVELIVPFENLEVAHIYNRNACPLLTVQEYEEYNNSMDVVSKFLILRDSRELTGKLIDKIKNNSDTVLIIHPKDINYHTYKSFLEVIDKAKIVNPIIIRLNLHTGKQERENLQVASQLGGLFIDRLIYSLWIIPDNQNTTDEALFLSQNILQAAGLRRFKTEFISCPGCGRTLFDLQKAVERVKAEFSHLNHLKIAVMGCVVNGPGEMGDADYGYVGAGNGKVNLFKGKMMVKAAIPEKEAIDLLKQLIIENGDWIEK